MRDLFLAPGFPPDVGGIQRLVFEVAKRFEKPVVITRSFIGDVEFDSRQRGFTIYRTPHRRSFFYKLLFPFSPFLAWFVENKHFLKRAVEVDKITRVHCTHIYTGLCGVYAKYRYGVPFVLYVHCQEVFPFYYPWYNPFSWFTRNLILKQASRVYTITPQMADYLSETVAREKITVIPLAADPKQFFSVEKDKKLVKKYGLAGKKVVLTISRFEAYKGIDKTIEAISLLSKKISNLVYLIGGEGEDRERLEKIVKGLNLSQKVVFVGEVPEKDLLAFYNLADVYILANRDVPQEGKLGGYGMVLLEANACEKPFVVGRAKYFDDKPIHGKTGFVVNPFDSSEIANALEKILSDKKFAAKLGKNGRKRVLAESNYDNMVRIITANINK